MKTVALATASALALAFATPALAMDCASKKSMQNAEAGTVQSEKTAEVAAAQTPLPAAEAVSAATEPQSAEFASAPAAEAPNTKN